MPPPEHKRNRPVQEFVESNFALDRKMKEACKDVLPNVQWSLMELPRNEDKELIADFLLNWSNESSDGMSMAPNTKRGYINALVYLARYHNHTKSFKEMSKEDIIDGYLLSLKRDFSADIEQKWVNTYNNRATKYLAFWKWMTQPDLRREERQLPPQLKGLRFAKRKNKTHVKQEDLWTPEEHKVFLERCEGLRLACFFQARLINTYNHKSQKLEQYHFVKKVNLNTGGTKTLCGLVHQIDMKTQMEILNRDEMFTMTNAIYFFEEPRLRGRIRWKRWNLK